MRRRISRFETTAWTAPERAKPRISAQSTSQVMPKAKLSACQSSCPTAIATITSCPAAAVFEVPGVRDLVSTELPPRDQVFRLSLEGAPAPAVTAAGPMLMRALDRTVVGRLLRRRQRHVLVVRGQAPCEADRYVVGVGWDSGTCAYTRRPCSCRT